MLDRNLNRRHLTASQRACITLELLPVLEQAAKERMSDAGRKSAPRKGAPDGAPFDKPKKRAADEAAKLTGASPTKPLSVRPVDTTDTADVVSRPLCPLPGHATKIQSVPRPPIRVTIHPPTVAEIVAGLKRWDRPSRLPADWPRTKHGLPIVEHDPNDPDDDHDGR